MLNILWLSLTILFEWIEGFKRRFLAGGLFFSEFSAVRSDEESSLFKRMLTMHFGFTSGSAPGSCVSDLV